MSPPDPSAMCTEGRIRRGNWELQGQTHLPKAAKGPGNHLAQYSQYLKGQGTPQRTHSWGQKSEFLLFNQGQFPQTAWLPPQMPRGVWTPESTEKLPGQRDTHLEASSAPPREKQSSSAFPPHFTNELPPWVLSEHDSGFSCCC